MTTIFLLLVLGASAAALNTQDIKLWSAVQAGEEDQVKTVLLTNPNPNTLKYQSKKTLLMHAVYLESYLTGDPTGTIFGPQKWGCNNDIAKQLIGAGADVNAKSKKGTTALMFAASNNFECEVGDCDVDCIQTLLDAGADLHTKDNDGRTALMHAGIHGSFDAMKILTDDANGADLYDHVHIDAAVALAKRGFQTEGKQMFAISLDARKRGGLCPEWKNPRLVNDPKIVKLARALNGKGNQTKALEDTHAALVDDVCHNKRRPLMNTTENNRLKEKVCTAENSQRTKNDGTLGILYWAAVGGHCGVFEITFVNAQHFTTTITICGSKNWTECMAPLKKIMLAAALQGGSEIIRIMTDTYGGDILIRKNKDENGDTPLSLAKANGHYAVQRILGVHTKRELISDLITHVHRGNISMVQQVLDAGADVNLHDLHGKSPLMTAIHNRKFKIAKLLLTAGAHADMGDLEETKLQEDTLELESGRTPLMYAAMGWDSDPLVQMLIVAGANVHAKDEYKSDSLMMASAYGNVNAIKSLLAAGANPRNVDINGRTAAEVCNTRSHCHYDHTCNNHCSRLLSRY